MHIECESGWLWKMFLLMHELKFFVCKVFRRSWKTLCVCKEKSEIIINNYTSCFASVMICYMMWYVFMSWYVLPLFGTISTRVWWHISFYTNNTSNIVTFVLLDTSWQSRPPFRNGWLIRATMAAPTFKGSVHHFLVQAFPSFESSYCRNKDNFICKFYLTFRYIWVVFQTFLIF